MPPHSSGRRRRRDDESDEESSRSSCRDDKDHQAKPAPAPEPAPAPAQTLLEALSSSLCGSQAEASGGCLTSPPVSRIWERLRRDWGRWFYARLDHQGCFHTYPDVGGPFQSLLETDKAIDRYLEARRDPKMCVEEDKEIRHCLYWPDGTIKRHIISDTSEKLEMCQLVQALVDKYNEDHNLLEDLAHELKDVLHYQSIFEKLKLYYHLNFTTKIKGAGPNECSMDNLFFVELKCMTQGKYKEQLVNCFCTVNLNDNGHCYGCTRRGNADLKHPSSSADEYTAGHLNVGLPIGYFAKLNWDYEDEVDDDKYVKAKEAYLRQVLGLDNPGAPSVGN